MPLDKKFYIHTGKDGILESTTDDDVQALVADLKSASKVVVHLHGGLVSKAAALENGTPNAGLPSGGRAARLHGMGVRLP
jgi:hypothetical protein